MKPTYPSVPPIDGNVPVLLSWDSKKARTLVWYSKKTTMRKSFQFDDDRPSIPRKEGRRLS